MRPVWQQPVNSRSSWRPALRWSVSRAVRCSQPRRAAEFIPWWSACSVRACSGTVADARRRFRPPQLADRAGGSGAMLEVLFITAVVAALYPLVGYPLVLSVIAALRPRPVARQAWVPEVTILIPAYNEAGSIAA